MNNLPTAVSAPHSGMEKDLTFIDILIALARHKKKIVLVPIVAGIITAGASFLLPNFYKATATLLPPQQGQSGAAALLAQFGGVASAAGLAAGIKNPGDLYIGMLRSRTVADAIIARFDLKKVYDTPSLEKARKTLEGATAITSGKDGLIVIEVEGKDKQLVAPMANAYYEELVKLTKVVAVTEASQRRKFFEEQLTGSKNALAQAELTLKNTLESGGVVSVDSDSRAIVETVSRLRAQIAAKEIQLSTMQAFVTPQNQEYRRAQEELNSARAELSRLQNGRPGAAGASGEARSAGLENIKILREVKYHQTLYELLSKQYEVARLDEAKDSSAIQILDKAGEPERKFRPKRAQLVIIAALLALLGVVLYAFGSEYRASLLRQPVRKAELDVLKSQLRWK